MNIAKTVYFDDNGNMIRDTRYKDKTNLIKKSNEVFNSELTLVRVGWQNNGSYFEFRDSDGKEFYMSENEFQNYLDTHEIVIQDDFTFYQQGTIFSLGMCK